MQENIEIEYKQLLTANQYTQIKEYLLRQDNYKIINQTNYYFETSNYSLKEQKTALRIRVIDELEYELCIKTQRENDILEKNYLINESEFTKICENPNLMKKYLENKDDYILLGSLDNIRIEFLNSIGLVCLDKSSYFNEVDYEIEFEANDYESEGYFKEYLEKFNIKYKRNLESKIQRFIKAYNNK